MWPKSPRRKEMFMTVVFALTLCSCFRESWSLECVNGTYQKDEQCVTCPSTCTKCNSEKFCTECKSGFWGNDACANNCSVNCADGICNKGTGNCVACVKGYFFNSSSVCVKCPDECTHCVSKSLCTECKIGYKGNVCNQICTNCKKGTGCDKDTGVCTDDCLDGFAGRICVEDCNANCKSCQRLDPNKCRSCADGHFGTNCENVCSIHCVDTLCFETNGTCIYGCNNGTWGDQCTNEDKEGDQDSSLPLAVLVFGVIAIICVITATSVVMVVICLHRRKKQLTAKLHRESKICLIRPIVLECGHLQNEQGEETLLSPPEHVLQGPHEADIHLRLQEPRRLQYTGEGIYAEVDDALIDGESWLKSRETSNKRVAGKVSSASIGGKISLEDLEEILETKTFNDYILEYQSLPLHMECDIGSFIRQPQVMQRVGTKNYINACLIDGHELGTAYIACSGPSCRFPRIFEYFWSMVWDEKCVQIIMLTDLVENGVIKCSQYWPDKGNTALYGDVTVTCRDDKFYDDFHKREFIIEKTKEEKTEPRTILQLHYTSWQENAVPKSIDSFFTFLQRATTRNVQPVVVHCSDGMGRTGTYLAIDILIHEGQTTGSVDVSACVDKLRRQRSYVPELQLLGMKMVQSAEQYSLIYTTLKYYFKQTHDKSRQKGTSGFKAPFHLSKISKEEQVKKT